MLSPGQSFSKYKIIRLLGTGMRGEVYHAWDNQLERAVALKVLTGWLGPDLVSDEVGERGGHAWPGLTTTLSHRNIAAVWEVGSEQGVSYIASELIIGTTLRTVLSQGALSESSALILAVQIAEGLTAAHGARVVHRALKPENVIVSAEGVVKLLDFSLGREYQLPLDLEETVSTERTQGVSWLDVISYMSPEQISGGSVDFRSDQFSFGTVL